MNTSITITALTIGVISGIAQAQHDDDFVVGIDATGLLSIEGDFDEAHELPAFNDGGTNGWFGDEPGYTNLDEDEPDEGFFMLGAGADIYFELLSADPAFKVYDPFFTEMAPGDTFAFGGHEFDEHPFWHIDSDDPSFDPGQTVWNVSWRVIDLGSTGYGASDVYTSQFTNIPAPGATVLLAGAMAWGASRRRR